MAKLSELVDGTTLLNLPAADRAKYQEQTDGTFKLVGDPTPSAETDEKQLALVIKSRDYEALPDEFKPYYTNKYADLDGNPVKDGTFKLRGFEDTTALKNALGHVKAERDLVRDKLKEYDGFDATELKSLREMSVKLKKDQELQRSEFDRQFTEAAEQYKTEIQLQKKENELLRRDLSEALIRKQAAIDVGRAGGTPELLLPHIEDHAEMRQVDGRNVAVVIGDDGKPRLRKGATQATDFLPIADYVEELRGDERFAGAFPASGASGGGATNRGQTAPSGDAPATVSKHDLKAIGLHADSIAAGKTKVV